MSQSESSIERVQGRAEACISDEESPASSEERHAGPSTAVQSRAGENRDRSDAIVTQISQCVTIQPNRLPLWDWADFSAELDRRE